MRIKTLALAFVLASFFAFSTWAVLQTGVEGFLDALGANPATWQVSMDLVIAMTLICGWMIKDARRRGARWAPFVLAAPFVGSMSPLLYLALRSAREEAPAASAPAGGRVALA